jgi:uncharacterized membrane protein
MKGRVFPRRKIQHMLLLFFFFALGIFSAVLCQRKINDFDIMQPRIDFYTASEQLPRQTAVDGLRNRSFINLFRRIKRRDLSVESLVVSGILYVEQEGDFFFLLNANRSARLNLDGQEIVQSSVLKRDLNRAVSVFLSTGLHPFQLHFVPSRQGPYLHLLWRQTFDRELRIIPDVVLFSPYAAGMDMGSMKDIQSRMKSLSLIKNAALFLSLISILGAVSFVSKTYLKTGTQKNGIHAQLNRISSRLTDIDMTKGLAGLPMIAVHLDGGHIFPFGVFGASLFFLCSGMNTFLFIERTKNKKNYNFYHLFFIVLLFFGGYTQIVVAHPGISHFMPEFLQFSALSMLVIFLLSKIFKKMIQIGYVFPVPFLLHFIYQMDFFPFIDRFPRLSAFVFGSDIFPLFPWCGFFLFGIFLLHLRKKRWQLGVTTAIAGLVSFLSVFVFKVPITKFNMSLSYVLLSLFVGVSIFLFFNFLSSESLHRRFRTLLAPLEVIGRNSLMFVYVHYFALAYIPLQNFIEYPFLMLLIKSLILFLFCSFCVFYYERSKHDSVLFVPILLLVISLVFLRYGGFLSVEGDQRLIDILIGLGFAFLYVQLRSRFRVYLKERG